MVEHVTGNDSRLIGQICAISKKHYRIIKDTSVGGDAPKELLRVYEYEKGTQRTNPRNWPIYIVKTGHKWYPFESITEYLLNRIGQVMGMQMAESRLAFINGQIRFMSKLFRTDYEQILEHGAELYSGYLGDRGFVEEVEENQMAQKFFTVSFTRETIMHIYPHQGDAIFLEFARMLVFDAIVGNNDRHFYNWGVLKHLKARHQPYFSPIYDTARAFFWNRSEKQLLKYDPVARTKMIRNYVHRSKPKIGIERKENCNHEDIVRLLCANRFSDTRAIVYEMITEQNQKRVHEMLHDEFGHILSPIRLSFITECVNLRFTMLKALLQ